MTTTVVFLKQTNKTPKTHSSSNAQVEDGTEEWSKARAGPGQQAGCSAQAMPRSLVHAGSQLLPETEPLTPLPALP